MTTLYYTCLGIGLFYTVISIVLGNLMGDIGIDIDLPLMSALPMKPVNVMIFLVIFGSSGLVCTIRGYGTLYGFLLSIIIAYAISVLMYKFVFKPIYNAQGTSTSTKEEIIGLKATVIETIIEGKFGQIKYSNKGNSFSSAAKSIDGKRIDFRTKVTIIKIVDNVYYVDVAK